MGALLIEYRYEGDEEPWKKAIEEFLQNIASDDLLKVRFSYQVMRRKDDPAQRLHIPRWFDDATLHHLQSRTWFKDFAAQIQGFAGDSLQTTPLTEEFST